jgi:pantothenate kinase
MQRVAELDMLPDLVNDLVAYVEQARTRAVVGITGPPGAGKSTVAAQIVELAGKIVPAVVAPMDGFHRSAAELTEMGILELKGVPDSFDAVGFVALLRRLRTSTHDSLAWPTYDRARQEVVPSGTVVRPDDRLVIVEGNYLLLDAPPWDGVRPLLDAVWYLDAPVAVITARLVERLMRDRTPEEARAKVASTDLPNATLVNATKHRADLVLITPTEGG